MAVDNEIALSRLLGRIYTEVFQRKPQNPNKPLNRGTHNPYEQIVTDALKSRLITGTNVFEWAMRQTALPHLLAGALQDGGHDTTKVT
mgnify:CR=1 FL=1